MKHTHQTITIRVKDSQLKKILNSSFTVEGAIASKYADAYETGVPATDTYARSISVTFREDDLQKFKDVARRVNLSLEGYLSFLASIF